MTSAYASSLSVALAVTMLHHVSPTAASALLGRGAAWLVRGLFAFLCVASLAILQHHGAPALPALLGALLPLACASACTLCGALAAGAYQRAILGRVALFGVLLMLFACTPHWVLPREMRTVGVVLGFEAALSAYSYALHGMAKTRQWTWREMLFFVVINPVLVFADRGHRVGRPERLRRGLPRLLGGTLTIAAYETIDGLMLAPRAQGWLLLVPAQLRSLAFLATWMLAIYLLHTGLASLRLACMRLLGWEIPERYCSPWTSRSPADFWRRWNTYLGAWVRVYLFTPLGLHLRRSFPALSSRAATGAALLLSFTFVGALHDLCLVLQGNAPGFPVLTLAFAAQAFVLVLWEAAARRASQLAVPGPLAALLSRSALFAWLAAMASVVLPALGAS